MQNNTYLYLDFSYHFLLIRAQIHDQYKDLSACLCINIYSCAAFVEVVFGILPALFSVLLVLLPRQQINTVMTFLLSYYQCLMPHL